MFVLCSKLRNRKAAQCNKMTAEWINSMPPITISDDDNDDDDAPDNQPNNTSCPAAESGHCETDQPSTDVASKHFSTEHSDAKTTCIEIPAVDSAKAADTKPSADMPVNTVKPSSEMLPDETVDSKCPEQVLSAELNRADTVEDAKKPVTDIMDVDDKNSAAEVAVAGSVERHTGSPSVDIAGITAGTVIDNGSSEVKTDKKIECSSKEDDKVLSSG